jgi:hypothetical protein
MYDYVIKLCKTKAELILNHIIPNVHGIRQEEAMHGTYKRLKFGGGQAYDHSAYYSQFHSR